MQIGAKFAFRALPLHRSHDLFADNEELFAKFRGGNPGYDLIVPTQWIGNLALIGLAFALLRRVTRR